MRLGSVDQDARAGAWIGLHFGSEALSGSRVTFADISQGGQEISSGQGCLTLYGVVAGNVSVTDTSFAYCAASAVRAYGETSRFAAFARNSVSSGEVGLWMHANTIGSVQDAVRFTDVARNRITEGHVSETAEWQTQSIDWHVETDLNVYSDDTGVTALTLTGGTLRFTSNYWLSVAYSGAGALMASGVTFASIDPNATSPSWVGLVFFDETARSALRDVLVTQAGQRVGAARGALTLLEVGNEVTIENSRFEGNGAPDIYYDCDSNPTVTNNAAVVYSERLDGSGC
ncbi:MAG: hypothetical protein FJ138_13695 [Deltaproteobacteria bacterium]|nr:hypothetical protein [Deltaproteobacteria bacterium]